MNSAAIRRALVVLALMVSFVAATPAFAGSKSADEAAPTSIVADILILRPLGIATTALGAAMFAVSGPICALVAPTQIGVPFDILVKRPVVYVWGDELGTH
jgi:hypothetical protein